ncbi:MAG TPA: methyltransferase domain-containing protein [Candidatus Blautia stercoripullorum]|uniref:Methyltransferase domain-containing protein n=1 Tax=Candidatus Blautia stercoripullorum TaxID=2838502 RepID=A0A9D2R8B7_9FIRM|nr:methyltransferase domain-containing protein [Candidatus Blautia stercoripullorum]
MKPAGYYTSGQFAKMAHISVRTVRFYDKQDILKPSYVSPAGSRFYTDQDFARLQQILLLKYLGFSLEDIKEMTIDDTDYRFTLNSLSLQQKLVRDRIEQLKLVETAIEDTTREIRKNHSVNWSHMLDLIHLTGMEKSLKGQYLNSRNISDRIRLHSLYSRNKEGWFPWLFRMYRPGEGMKILELGCGDGSLWSQNREKLPGNLSLTLSDISQGMLRDAKRNLGGEDPRFDFQAFDCQNIPFSSETFDMIIADHVLFYCRDLDKALQEIKRVLKPEGVFFCSAYGARHMEEISRLVQDFDSRIILSADKLYEKFGKENGPSILGPYFSKIEWHSYEDSLLVTQAEPLIAYILSCHGNQNQYILDRYKEFRSFVSKKTAEGFYITKDAGFFSCKN